MYIEESFDATFIMGYDGGGGRLNRPLRKGLLLGPLKGKYKCIHIDDISLRFFLNGFLSINVRKNTRTTAYVFRFKMSDFNFVAQKDNYNLDSP